MLPCYLENLSSETAEEELRKKNIKRVNNQQHNLQQQIPLDKPAASFNGHTARKQITWQLRHLKEPAKPPFHREWWQSSELDLKRSRINYQAETGLEPKEKARCTEKIGAEREIEEEASEVVFWNIKIRWDLPRVDSCKGAEPKARGETLLYGVRQQEWSRHRGIFALLLSCSQAPFKHTQPSSPSPALTTCGITGTNTPCC